MLSMNPDTFGDHGVSYYKPQLVCHLGHCGSNNKPRSGGHISSSLFKLCQPYLYLIEKITEDLDFIIVFLHFKIAKLCFIVTNDRMASKLLPSILLFKVL